MLFITGEKIFTKLKKKKCGTLKILVHNSSVQRTDHLKDCRHGLPLKAASFLYYRKTRLQKRKGRRRRVNLHYGCVSKKKKKFCSMLWCLCCTEPTNGFLRSDSPFEALLPLADSTSGERTLTLSI